MSTVLDKKAKRRDYYLANRDREIQKANDWNKRNRERCNANTRTMNAQTPERHQEHVKNWRSDNPDKVKVNDFSRNARRRLALTDNFVEQVDRVVVFQRDEGVCGICCGPVDKEVFHVDHVIPLSQGGKHCYANVQVAHPECNWAKGATTIENV